MKSIKELFRIGHGPSSSHTMGPHRAAEIYLARHPEAKSFQVTLYGSLAATGRGHLTDVAISQVLGNERTRILWHPEIVSNFHPNGMCFETVNEDGQTHDAWIVYSVGGGALAEEGENHLDTPEVYDMDSLLEIARWCDDRGLSYWEYVEHCEGPEIWDYLTEVWSVMKKSVECG